MYLGLRTRHQPLNLGAAFTRVGSDFLSPSFFFRDSFTAKAVSPPAEVAPATIIPMLAMQNGHIASPLRQRRNVIALPPLYG